MVVKAMMILGVMAAAGGCGGAFPSARSWKPAEQPTLKAALEKAPTLATENLAAPARSVLPWNLFVVPGADGKSWKVLKWYMKEYRQKTRVYIADTATGNVKLQTFPEWEGKSRPEEAYPVLAWDGCSYGATPNWDKWYTGGEMLIFKFDPNTDAITLWKTIPGFGGERSPLVLGPDGRMYCTGTYMADKNHNKVGAFWFDVKTGETKVYAPLGPDHGNDIAYGYFLGVDDEYIYVTSGKIPWYLLATNIKTGETKILKEATPGDYPVRMELKNRYPGTLAIIQHDDNAPKEEFWLWHGEAIPKKDDTPPWPKMQSPWDKLPPRPQVYDGQCDPDANGRAVIWWRSHEDAAKAQQNPTAGTKPEDLGWKPVYLEGLETYPLPVHMLINLPDGRMFGTAGGYQGRFLYDPKTDKATPLGRGTCSIYAMTEKDGKVCYSGYPSAPIFEFDPNRPWTVEKGGPPGQAAPDVKSAESNPRNIGTPFAQTRVKKMLDAVVAADGKVYFGGRGQRDYDGGGLGWYDPKTKSFGGLWKPFSAYPIFWLTTACDGRYVIVSTRTAADELNGGKEPAQGRVFVYDTVEQKVVRDIEPVANAEKAGPLVEVAPGLMLGTTEAPEVKGGGVLYGLDILTGKILFLKKLPVGLAFQWTEGVDQWDFRKGPDGNVYTYLGNVMVRILPKKVEVEVLGKVEQTGRMTFLGKDLYLAGADNIRKVANILQR